MVMGELTLEADVVVIGAGPGGYAAAFRAADLGLDVTMIDMDPRLGGVCLLRGCIPSKALLFVTELMHDTEHSSQVMGIRFEKPQIDLDALRGWKNKVIDKLCDGLVTLSKTRGVQLVQGRAVFESSNSLRLYESDVGRIKFRRVILATGSRPFALPGSEFKEGSRIMDSTGALALADIPGTLLVVGGGYVGMELGSVYAALGSRVTVVEMSDRLMPGADRDLVEPLVRRVQKTFESIRLNTGVMAMEERDDGVRVTLRENLETRPMTFDRVLVAVGRRPNTEGIGLENTTIKLNERGFIIADQQQQTTDPRILAIGDVVGGAMLAHKAMREGKVAAEVIAGLPAAFDVRAIPAVVFTDPQIAWCGLTEEAAKKENRPVKISRFPWSASGRAATMDAPEGVTKMIFDPETERLLGVGIVGRGAGEMIAEGVLAVEMGALAEDMALSIHPHPTLSETEAEAAEAFLGSATHIFSKPKSH